MPLARNDLFSGEVMFSLGRPLPALLPLVKYENLALALLSFLIAWQSVQAWVGTLVEAWSKANAFEEGSSISLSLCIARRRLAQKEQVSLTSDKRTVS